MKNKKKWMSWKMEEMPERKLGYCGIPTDFTTFFSTLRQTHLS